MTTTTRPLGTVEFNSETWHVVSSGACPGNCPYSGSQDCCGGVIGHDPVVLGLAGCF